jgi:hypothetical protein
MASIATRQHQSRGECATAGASRSSRCHGSKTASRLLRMTPEAETAPGIPKSRAPGKRDPLALSLLRPPGR